jgi:peptide/nickel transport system permease protein
MAGVDNAIQRSFVIPALQPRKRPRLDASKLKHNLPVLFGALIVVIVVSAALLADAISPHDPTLQEISERLLPPSFMTGGSPEYFLGTDPLGRDTLSRIIHGSRVSLTVGIAVVLLSGTIGVTLALISGFRGGRIDLFLARVADVQQAIPFLILAIAVVAVLGASLLNLILVLGITTWVFYFRVVRAEVLATRQEVYVEAARVVGCGNARSMLRHILPNVAGSIIVIATLLVASTIIFEASLSFLGLGVQPPTPTWGGMVSDGRDYLADAWWVSVFPGMAILFTVLGINLCGDWLRDKLDPKLKD